MVRQLAVNQPGGNTFLGSSPSLGAMNQKVASLIAGVSLVQHSSLVQW
jgi:hypothetical protein